MTSFTVIIETPKHCNLKFKFDKKSKHFILHKMLPEGMAFPFDFGFIPGTKGGDGDPLDIISISEFGTFTGCAIECRLIGVMLAEQTEKNNDTIRNDRFFVIPVQSRIYKDVFDIKTLPAELTTQLQDFFINYNKIEHKEFSVLNIVGPEDALKFIKHPVRKIMKK